MSRHRPDQLRSSTLVIAFAVHEQTIDIQGVLYDEQDDEPHPAE